METIDLRKNLKLFYQPGAKDITLVDVPSFSFLMADGTGDPNHSAQYAAIVQALFAVSYSIKFKIKKGIGGIDYGVMPLEGLWWADDMTRFSVEDKSNWQWTMMIMQPDFVSEEIVRSALFETVKKKGQPDIEQTLKCLRYASFTEGLCAQVLHIGPFTAEGPTIERLHAFIDSHGEKVGKHHEIYLSDIRKANPAGWKTIIRQPMRS